MTKSQIKVFEALLADPTFKGKKSLRHLLWLNTVKPKYGLGECFKVTDPGHRVYGHPVRNFNAKIIEIVSFRDYEEYRYKLEAEVECDGRKTLVNVYMDEADLRERCKGNLNILGEAKSKVVESLDA